MADTPETTSQSDFLSEAPGSVKSEDMLYNDFFQENSHGEVLSTGVKRERSDLEIGVSILRYVTIFIVIIGIVSALHVFIRSSQTGSFLETYPFLCPYLHYDIKTGDDYDKGCKSIDVIQAEYLEKEKVLEENILNSLAEYIPIKVSSSILDASPERKFIITTFQNKPNVKNVLEAFEAVKKDSQHTKGDNIKCTGITITNGDTLSTQCEIFGGDVGNADTNGEIGSARIQALHFIENLTDTIKYSLVLDSRPTTMSIEKLQKSEDSIFTTKTNLPIQVRYVPLNQKL